MRLMKSGYFGLAGQTICDAPKMASAAPAM
jgi:hypothetical protein